MDEEIPPSTDPVKAQLRTALARRHQQPVTAAQLRRCCFYAALPQSYRSASPARGGLLGRLFRLARRSFLVFRGPRRQPSELGPGGVAA
jgi:hypothetical protein